jgi:hypothetical protein
MAKKTLFTYVVNGNNGVVGDAGNGKIGHRKTVKAAFKFAELIMKQKVNTFYQVIITKRTRVNGDFDY